MEKRFEFLDSIRGLSALSVLHVHAFTPGDFYHGYSFGVMMFFLLSSFLLTYQLLLRYEKTTNTIRDKILISVNYLIMRFFRVYVPFIVFIILSKLISYSDFVHQHSIELPLSSFMMLSFNSLSRPAPLFLWTIPVEIKFYFFIPFIALTGIYFNLNYKLAILFHTSLLIFVWNLSKLNLNTRVNGTWLLINTPVFLIGCSIAILIKSLEDHKLPSNRYLSYSIEFISWLMFLVGARLEYFLNSHFQWAVYWFINMLLMILAAPNNFTDFLTNFQLLRLIGKYSYGFYLFHGISMTLWQIIYSNYIRSLFYKIIILTGQTLFFGFIYFHLIENNCIKLAKTINSSLLNKFKLATSYDNDNTELIQTPINNQL